MNNNQQQTPKPMEKAVFSYTDDKLAGIALLLSYPLIITLRKRIGIRMLRVDSGVLLVTGLSAIAHISDWVRNLPLLGSRRRTDMALWKLFIAVFAILFAYHLIVAFREMKQKKYYTYTRSLGRSHLWPIFKNSPLKFLKTELDFQIFVEPVLSLVFSLILIKFAPNLGVFLSLSSMCLLICGWKIRSNMLNVMHDANDAAVISDVVIQGESEHIKASTKMATGVSSNRTQPSSDRDEDIYI